MRALVLVPAPRRDLLQCRDQIARQQAVPESFPEHPLRDLTGDDSGLSPAMLTREEGNEGAQPPLHIDSSLLLERPIGVLDGVGVHFQFVRQFSARGQRFIRLQNSNRHTPSDLIGDLPVNRPGIGFIYVD